MKRSVKLPTRHDYSFQFDIDMFLQQSVYEIIKNFDITMILIYNRVSEIIAAWHLPVLFCVIKKMFIVKQTGNRSFKWLKNRR